MPSTKSSQDRGRENRRMAAARAAEAQRRRRRLIGTGVAAALVVLILIVVATRGSDTKSTASTATSTTAAGSATTAAGSGSAAGKPCVALNDTLPTGAPDVPVQVGPPPTSLVVQDIKVGDGAAVTASNTVTVNYIGVSCSTGKIFDSSYKTGQPATFPLAQVIPGWTQGLAGMKVGGTRLLGIPPALGYGDAGSPPVIAPGETLWFVVEMISAK